MSENRYAFVYPNTLEIHSIYISSPSIDGIIGIMPTPTEPETPEGCVRVDIPLTIQSTDAIKAILQNNEIIIVDDEEKLTYLRNIALPHIRKTRNELLALTDYKMMTDYTLTEEQRTIWTAYRQALRDITSTQDPLKIIWPTMPSS